MCNSVCFLLRQSLSVQVEPAGNAAVWSEAAIALFQELITEHTLKCCVKPLPPGTLPGIYDQRPVLVDLFEMIAHSVGKEENWCIILSSFLPVCMMC